MLNNFLINQRKIVKLNDHYWSFFRKDTKAKIRLKEFHLQRTVLRLGLSLLPSSFIRETDNWPLNLFILFIINKDKANDSPNEFEPIMIAMTKKMNKPISPFSIGISTKIVPFIKFRNRKSKCFITMNCFPGRSLIWNQIPEANVQEIQY